MDSLRKGSRQEFSSDSNSIEAIAAGCMQRMADSLERMEKPYLKLISDLEYTTKRVRELNETVENLRRSNMALKGHITRLKNNSNNT